jgi:hypothetical protein
LTSIAAGLMSVEVTMKNISNKKMTSVIDDIENVACDEYCFLSAMLQTVYLKQMVR